MNEITVEPIVYLVTMLPPGADQGVWSLRVEDCGQPWNAPPTDRVWAVRHNGLTSADVLARRA